MSVTVPTSTVQTWADFQNAVDECADTSRWARTGRRVFWFLGQAREGWSLRSSLSRLLRDTVLFNEASDSRRTASSIITIERSAVAEFRRQAHLYLPMSAIPSSRDPSDWWPLMQQYGAPTRLLDWTRSPYVAAYFAVLGNESADGPMWVLDRPSMEHALSLRPSKSGHIRIEADKVDFPGLRFVDDVVHTDRMAAQQTVMTYSTRIAEDHEAFTSLGAISRIIIRASQKIEFCVDWPE